MLGDSVELDPADADPAAEVDDGFHVTDERSANWVVRRVVEARRYADRVRAWAAAEIRRAEREERFFLHRFGRELEDWCRGRIASDGGRRRSVNLPGGVVGFRRAPAGLDVVDEGKLLAWCRMHLRGAVVVRESVAKTAIVEHVEGTGEVPDGLAVRAAGDRFYVK